LHDCVVVADVFTQTGEEDDTITSWYAPNVGMVRQEHHVGDALADKLELLSHTLVN